MKTLLTVVKTHSLGFFTPSRHDKQDYRLHTGKEQFHSEYGMIIFRMSRISYYKQKNPSPQSTEYKGITRSVKDFLVFIF